MFAASICIPAFVSIFAYVFAGPVFQMRNALDVWSPPILSPAQDTIWRVDTVQTVRWSTANAPPAVSNAGYVALRGPDDLFLFLAKNFPLETGSVQITVPVVPPGSDYFIILFGTSSNASPHFTICQTDCGSESGVANER